MNATMPVWGAVVLAPLPQIAAFVLQRSRLAAEAALQKERMAADAERERQNRDEDRAEEWHRNVRWAAEQIIAGTRQGRVTGVEMLDVLDDAELDDEDGRVVWKVELDQTADGDDVELHLDAATMEVVKTD